MEEMIRFCRTQSRLSGHGSLGRCVSILKWERNGYVSSGINVLISLVPNGPLNCLYNPTLYRATSMICSKNESRAQGNSGPIWPLRTSGYESDFQVKSRMRLVPPKSTQKTGRKRLARKTWVQGPFPLPLPIIESLCWFSDDNSWGKCDLWRNEACSSTDEVHRWCSPSLAFPKAELALLNSLLLFQLWCQEQQIPQALGRVLSDGPSQGLT